MLPIATLAVYVFGSHVGVVILSHFGVLCYVSSVAKYKFLVGPQK